jgi:transposase
VAGMKAYGEELRARIVAARQQGHSVAAVAARFAVGKSSVERYVARLAAQGTLAAKARSKWPSRLEGHEQALRGWINKEPELTLAALCARLQRRRGVRLGVSALWHGLRRMGLSYKKRACTPPSRSART